MATRQRKTKQEIDLDFGLLSEAEQAEFRTQAMVEVELRRRYGTSFKEFIRNVNPDYKFYKHTDVLTNVFEKVADGLLKRVMIWLPPRHSKSETASRLFPSYYMFKNPKHHIGLSSYSAELAYSLSRKARENYEQTGRILSEEASSVKEWHTEMDGVFWSAGVGGSITGRGFHCFPSGTMIQTEIGEIEIEKLCLMPTKPKVLSFNHERGSLEYCNVVASAISPASEFIKIRMDSGREVTCTPEHLIYCGESGYKQARDIIRGETVIQIASEQEVSYMQQRNWEASSLSTLLPLNKNIDVFDSVRVLFNDIRETLVRNLETIEAWSYRFLLFDPMFAFASCNEASSEMSGLRRMDGNKNISLLSEAQERTQECVEAVSQHQVRILRENIQASQSQDKVLLNGVQEQTSLGVDGGEGKQSLQRCTQLRGLVSEDAPNYFREGQLLLRYLWCGWKNKRNQTTKSGWWVSKKNKSIGTSYRLEPNEQRGIESGDALREMSQSTPQKIRRWETDTVSMVTRICGQSQPVFDIQVKNNNNFFANKILVHNCGIIDDPIKGAEEANSQLIRDKQWDWYQTTFYTRREPQAAIVIIMTRWHDDDLCGKLLRQETESPENWHIVNLEAIKSNDPVRLPSTCTIEKDWRKEGQALCPERYDVKELGKIRRAVGETTWRSLYQQRPIAEDGIIWKKAWFEGKTFEKLPVDIVNEGYDWDTAYTKDEGNAASAYVKAGVGSDGNIYVTDMDFKWLEFPEFVNWTAGKKDRPHYIEQKSTGKSVVQSLRKVGMYAQEVKVFGGDKVARAKVATPIVERGKVFIHKNIITRLLYDDRQGILKFPNGTHADLNDAFVQMLNRLRPFTKIVEQVKKKEYESYDDYMEKEVFAKIHEKFGQPKQLAWHQK